MLKNQEVCNFLTEKLNDSVLGQDYQFTIYSEIGKNTNDNTIKGILRVVKNEHLPVPDLKETDFSAVVEFLTPANCSNKALEKVESIIGAFKNVWNGKEYQFENGKGVITFTSPLTDYFKTENGIGNTVPLRLWLNITYTENVATSASKVWQIRPLDVENAEFLTIPFLSESVYLEKGGKTSNINDALFQQTLLTSQIKYYRFEIPYETENGLGSMLQKDILTGDFGKKYELKFYDGVSFTASNPFTTTVSIFRSGDSSSTRPKTANFNITFSDVDGGNNTIKYYLALVDNPFDSLSENTQYFANQTEQQEYFVGENGLVSQGADFDEIPAPNLNSLYLTSQVYLNTRKYDIFDLINKNYAIIKATNGTFTKYFYYVVNNGDIGANGQVNYNLTMDTVQTYLPDANLDIQGSFIQKSHLNRWIQVDANTVKFNGKADSTLFEREEIKEVAKRLVFRSRLKYDVSNLNLPSQSTESNSIFNIEKTRVWVYIFLDGQYGTVSLSNIKYNFYNLGQSSGTLPQASLDRCLSDNITTPTAILAYPLDLREDVKIGELTHKTGTPLVEVTTNIYTGHDAFLEFIAANPTVFTYIKAIKLSIKQPLNVNEITYDGLIRLSSDTYRGWFNESATNILTPNFILTGKYSATSNRQNALIYVLEDNLTPFDMILENESNMLPQITFTKNYIKNGNKSKLTNPKLNSIDYKEVSLNIAGSQIKLDFQKLNNKNPIFTYLEPLTCDTTKMIIRYKSDDNEAIFNEDYSYSYNGLLVTNDMSLPIANDNFSQYLANNKNAYLSFQNQQQYAIDRGALSFANQTIGTMLDPTKAITSGVGSVENFIGMQMSLEYNQAQFNLSMDNMRSSPLNILNANGSAIFANAISKYGIYLELYEGLDTELEMANDIMFRDGYNYNRFGEIKDFINIRKNFNYIKAILGNISGLPISEEARRNLKQRFASGIRFWNKNDNNQYAINYINENYENWLDTNYTSFEEWLESTT